MPAAKVTAEDPLALSGIDADAIQNEKAAKKAPAPPSAHEVAKEERLAAKEKRLAAGKEPQQAAAASSSTAAPGAPSEDKSKLLDRLFAYRERFPHLKKRNNVTVKSSVEDIQDEIHYCEVQLGSKSDSNLGTSLLVAAAAGIESFTRDVYNPLNLQLTGLSRVTQDNLDTFSPIVDELMIKYGAGMVVSPETRLVLAFGTMVYTCHVANTGDPRFAAALHKMNQAVPAGTEDAKDL